MRIEPATCPVCGAEFDPLRARAIAVLDGKVKAYCSTACKERKERAADPEPVAAAPPPRRGRSVVAALGAFAVGALALVVGARLVERNLPRAAASLPVPPPKPPAPKPPSKAEAMAIFDSSDDGETEQWFHPLYGPERVLPRANTRRFGAAREGLRPEECEGGHCGVDLGTARGEPVLAAHDGVVERVVRDAEEGGRRGNEGRFIRINHKGGTIVTSYMHLDSIRDDLKPGIPVKAGEPIATIGESGVQHSGPHLHFAVSFRPKIDEPELFIDPEPLLHLWPLKDPPPGTAMRPSRHRTAQVAPAVAQGG
jgi:murein DD-endopeptidase MepM/ murein hydrolase activator NlpD